MDDHRGSMQTARARPILWTELDTRRFGVLLQERYPRLRFLPDEYFLARAVDPTAATRLYQSGNLEVPYLPHLWEPPGRRVRAWNEPEGWHPQWRQRPEKVDVAGTVLSVLANAPSESISIFPAMVGTSLPHVMLEGRLEAAYEVDDAEAARFAASVWRLSARFSPVRLERVHDDTGEVCGEEPRWVWCAPDAAAWCAASPERRFVGNLRPVGAHGGPVPEKYWDARYCKVPERASNHAHIQALKAQIAESQRKTAERSARRAAARAAREAKAGT
jgi:hypothetical protein